MQTVTSKDGTTISYEQTGEGAPLILVDGAICHRHFGPMAPLAAQLAPHFTVYYYDRRGRGDSNDTLPYLVQREVEDIATLIEAAGGSAYVYGISSGAALALEAAISGLNIDKLALYEPPYNPDAKEAWQTYRSQLDDLLSEGQRGDAAALFMSYVGTPQEAIAGMKQAPMWAGFEAIAPTLAYDAAILDDCSVPTARAASVTIPTLVMAGTETFPFMHESVKALVKAMPNAQYKAVEGQSHDVAPDVIAPLLINFFS